VFLPLALFVIPTMTGVSAADDSATGNGDPMLDLASTRSVEADNISTPADTPTARTASQTIQTSTPTARTGNYLSIPGKVSSTVVDVGLDSDGAIAVPGSAIGMYNHGGGATFLDGHSTGVFAGLSRVQIGDIAEFTFNSQTTLYQVVNIVTYTYISGDNLDGSFMYDSLYSGGANGLNMMTCAGAYLPAYGTYSHRLVVFSVKI
jgi:sortase (surface protein transpeptidase)